MADDLRLATQTEAPGALRPDILSGRRRLPLAWLGTLPFFAYALAFLFVPAGEVMVGAFKGAHGGATLDHVRAALHQPYLHEYWLTIKVSLITAAGGAVLGLLIAYAAIREGTPRFIRTALTTFAGVAANFAGIPLAFAFIATLGTIGVATSFMRDHLGYDPYAHGFTLFGETGVEIVYLYFQIPLMILVIAPAIDGLRREWREAASNLGASSFEFWRYVGLPILMPSILGAFILLFGNSFSAYATAYGLTGGGLPLIPITIGYYYTGNVLSDPHLAQALAFGMFVVLAVMMLLYLPLQRRTARWMR
jgi:putative spermidine/putrescine transport system permease protein